LRARLREVAPNAFGKVPNILRPENGSITQLNFTAIPLEEAQAFDELLTTVFAIVREADLLLQPRAYGITIQDVA